MTSKQEQHEIDTTVEALRKRQQQHQAGQSVFTITTVYRENCGPTLKQGDLETRQLRR